MSRSATIAILMGGSLSAQWLNHPTPGIPRTSDGKPNLSAPAPRTPDGKPDLSGIWGLNPGGYLANIAADLPPGDIQPSADALYRQRMEDLGRDDPSLRCLPNGPRFNLVPFLMVKVIQTPALMAILSEDLAYRQIFLDGRTLPVDPNPTFMGYSVGHWERETLVVESTGFNDRTWLDFGGHPHSEALQITERYRRRDFGHMEIQQTLEDSKLYAKPWTVVINASLVPDTELVEYVCAENEKDRQHLVGKASDDNKYEVKVVLEILVNYIGMYEFSFPENPTNLIHYNVTLSGGDLFFDTEGKDKWRLIPLSETAFSLMGDRLEFRKDDRGVVTHLVFVAAEGDLKAVRKPEGK